MNRSRQLYILKNKTLLNQKNKNKITLTNMLQNLLEKDTVGRETENFRKDVETLKKSQK